MSRKLKAKIRKLSAMNEFYCSVLNEPPRETDQEYEDVYFDDLPESPDDYGPQPTEHWDD